LKILRKFSKKILVFSLIAIIAAISLPTIVLGTDTPSPWAIEHVNAAIAENIVPSNLQSNYTQALTRAEFCALVVAIYEAFMGEITGYVTFSDTNDINVKKAAYIGVVSGIDGNSFNPNDTLTREQAAVMLAQLANVIGEPLRTGRALVANFTDLSEISSWAVESVDSVVSVGFMSGIDDYRFAPRQNYTREQGIVSIMRLFVHVQIRNVEMPLPPRLPHPPEVNSRLEGTIEGPWLNVIHNKTTQQELTIRGVTNWRNEDGSGFMSDSAHSLQISQADLHLATLTLDVNGYGYNEIIEFQFSSPPQTVSAQRWNAVYSGIEDIDDAIVEYVPVMQTGEQNSISILNDGYDYIYEVHATWEEGFALFTFRTQSTQQNQVSYNEPSLEGRVVLISNDIIHEPGVHFFHGGSFYMSASGFPFESWLTSSLDTQPVIQYVDNLQIVIEGEHGQIATTTYHDPTHYGDFTLIGIYAESFTNGVATVSLPDEPGAYLLLVDVHWRIGYDWSALRYIFKIVK